MTKQKILEINPQGYVRRTHQGKYTDAAKKYHKYLNDLGWLALTQNLIITDYLPQILFIIQMPKSWPEKKKKVMDGRPHQQKPDLDNLGKAFLDALVEQDQTVWMSKGMEKRWGRKGRIVIR